MIYEEHSELEGKHAVFPPSNPAWFNYDQDRIINRYVESYAAEIGTSLHKLAEDLINEGERLGKGDKKVMSHHLLKDGFDRKLIKRFVGPFFPMFVAYVNDAITLGMRPELKLYYSDLHFGTTDAIRFFEDKGLLEIHDLKTGLKPAKVEQLEAYAALFCLQYKQDPLKMNFELRVYQGDEVLVHRPDPALIRQRCDIIIFQNKIINEFREGR